jgi:hypothetical protein
VLAALALAPAGGCGAFVSQGEFTAAADARCREFRREARGLVAPAAGLPSARHVRRLRSLMLTTVARLRRLTPPRGDAEEIARYLAGVEANAKVAGRLATALERGSPRRVRALRRRLVAGTATTRWLAQQYGFRVCGAA